MVGSIDKKQILNYIVFYTFSEVVLVVEALLNSFISSESFHIKKFLQIVKPLFVSEKF
jgi:hypothetical protein